MSVALWLVPLVVPLAAAGAALLPLRGRGWLLAGAPVPALALGLLGGPEAEVAVAWVLVDTRLGLDGPARMLLITSALLWAAAGGYARNGPGADRGFASLFLLTMTGNVGVLLAADAVSLYTSFSLMTVAGYGLVVHDRTPGALRAGRVYIALAIAGEVAIFSGLVLAVYAAGTTDLAALGPGVATSAHRDLTVGLLLAGFGVKAGIVPLHLWLPLAHPAAPVPASAVLSGAMIKAGLVGWIRVLPLGEVALPAWSTVVLAVGMATAAAGILVGLAQRDPKANLAYSSISQMGLMTVLVGVALGDPDAAPLAIAGATIYAMHHGFAKGSLFLGVGIAKAESDRRRHQLVLAGLALGALSLAGLPFTSGALAKVALKDAVGLLPGGTATAVGFALSLGAAGTTLLMGRLLLLVARPAEGGRVGRDRWGPWAIVVAAVAVASWVLPGAILQTDLPTASVAVVWDGLWPVLLGGALLAGAWQVGRRFEVTLPVVPPGDAVVAVEAVAGRLATTWTTVVTPLSASAADHLHALQRTAYLGVQPGSGVDRIDRRLTRWRTAGVLFAVLGVGLVVVLAVPGR
jgi:formate hydrogenlyase subunit 3/multisubunit Na+/H+ antiporter MnhD subunit